MVFNIEKVYYTQIMVNGKTVYVGLSGGVDSAVSAAMLKNNGYDVTGVFIKAWTPFDEAQGKPLGPCIWKEDRRSAMRAAAVLDIPFVTLDLEKEYKKEVVDYMIAEYKAGRTPNPDVMCNKEIKFGAFLNWAKKNGADYIATGHYAIRYENHTKDNESKRKKLEGRHLPPLSKERSDEVRVRLFEGADKNKDQSYFLWTLTQEQLKYVLFPVGHLQKEEVRKLAKQFGLPQATRKDSQGLCFLGQVDMKEFLSRYIKQKMGNVLNKKGETIGYHNGAAFFTIGERHGFTITKKNPNDKPLYVVSKDIAKNTITVSENTTPYKKSQRASLTLKGVNWILGRFPPKNDLSCRLRYRQKKIKCKAQNKKSKIEVLLQEENYLPAQAGISPGQSLVFYNGEECLGGGIVR